MLRRYGRDRAMLLADMPWPIERYRAPSPDPTNMTGCRFELTSTWPPRSRGFIVFRGYFSPFPFSSGSSLFQAVAFSRHINEVVHSANGDLNYVRKVFAGGVVAGSQSSFGQVPNK